MTMTDIAKRIISADDLMMAQNCPFSVLAPESSHARDEANRTNLSRRLVARSAVTQALINQADVAGVITYLEEALPDFTEGKRAEILTEAAKFAGRPITKFDEGEDVRIEKIQSWLDRQGGWTIYYKPDRVETMFDDDGEFIQVSDWAMSRKVRLRHIEKIRLFGLGEFMQSQGRLRIKLVVESLIDKRSRFEEWILSPHTAVQILEQTRKTFLDLEHASKPGGVARRRKGEHCFACHIQHGCNEGKKWLDEKRKEQALQAAELKDRRRNKSKRQRRASTKASASLAA